MESKSKNYYPKIGVYIEDEDEDSSSTSTPHSKYSCCIPSECKAVIIIKKDNDLWFFGLDNVKEVKESKMNKKNTWIDVISLNVRNKKKKKIKGKWSGDATFDIDGIYNPKGSYDEQGPIGYRALDKHLCLETTIRILLPSINDLTLMQQQWLDADESRSGTLKMFFFKV
tara:strand:- start:30 stop:539 length:510 start_codon:yes stop_codon:yes gene_type:complete